MTRLSWRRLKTVKPFIVKSMIKQYRLPFDYTYNNRPTSQFICDSWQKLIIDKIETENYDTKRFTLILPDDDKPSGLPVSSYLNFKGYYNGNEIIKPYTPISDGGLRGLISFVIKIYPHKLNDEYIPKMSQYLQTLNDGDTIEVCGPFNKIEYPFKDKLNIVMICAGTGITPFIQILKEMQMHREYDQRYVTLLNFNKTSEDIICQAELMGFQQMFKDRIQIHNIIEFPNNEQESNLWNQYSGFGRVNAELLQKYLPEPNDDLLIMTCGPPGFSVALCGDKESYKNGKIGGLLHECGYAYDMIHRF